jgi:hypothetical protein
VLFEAMLVSQNRHSKGFAAKIFILKKLRGYTCKANRVICASEAQITRFAGCG